MQMATMSHHSWHRAGGADASTQTLTYIAAATCAATASVAASYAATPAQLPVIEHVVPATHVVPVALSVRVRGARTCDREHRKSTCSVLRSAQANSYLLSSPRLPLLLTSTSTFPVW